MYGWSGGSQHSHLAARTDDLLVITHNELEAQPNGLQFICGDFNAESFDVHALQAMITTEDDEQIAQWTYFGTNADVWGQRAGTRMVKASSQHAAGGQQPACWTLAVPSMLGCWCWLGPASWDADAGG